jgi:hypothetical protein
VFFLEGVTSEAPSPYINYMLCKELGWSYRDLIEQPRSFVEEMIEVMGIVNKMEIRNHGLR